MFYLVAGYVCPLQMQKTYSYLDKVVFLLKLVFTGFIISVIASCKNKPIKVPTSPSKSVTTSPALDTRNAQKVSSVDWLYFADSVLYGQKDVLKYYFTKYKNGTCPSLLYDKKGVIENFEGLLALGNIRKGRKCSVFVLSPLNYCKFGDEDTWDGEAYYFTDTSLPRLQTDSYCCHPGNLFLIGDIDEDGVSEIGQYYSSCASHYKSILVWTLKNNYWRQVGQSVFDQHYMTYDKPFSSLVRKLSKNKFEMFEITDLTEDSTKTGKGNWKRFSM